MKKADLVIIGGGIMGLFTAYFASQFVDNITILEKNVIGADNTEAASFGFTRSIRVDYLDPLYASLAYESKLLWEQLQNISKERFLIPAGCLNLAKKAITKDIRETYGYRAGDNLKNMSLPIDEFSKKDLAKSFPQFEADYAMLDKNGGFLLPRVITKLLLDQLRKRNVQIVEDCTVTNIVEGQNSVRITTQDAAYESKSLVITAALGTNALIKKIKNCSIKFPMFPDKPQECKYVYIPKRFETLFAPDKFPVFAYLDVGIYGHPIFDKKKTAIKIGYYNPLDINRSNTKIQRIDDFIRECLPRLIGARTELVIDADQCNYDMVIDDNFILGKLPGKQTIFVGCGWRGTGYKFAPLIGKILSQLSVQKRTVYDITAFSPERFVKI